MSPNRLEDSRNVTGLGAPPRDVVRPADTDELQAVVLAARRDGIGLYPVSTGLNWGYGSHVPVRAGCRIVDLSRMNRILNADEIGPDNPVAVVEPGVTQGQLSDFLAERCPRLTFNATGSGRDTSIIGCSLDRGVGYFGPRREDLYGLEIVSGAGDVICTGFRRLGEESPLAHSHPYGLGPILDGLLFQGNFGIVTSACFRLRRRRPREVAVSLSLRDHARLAEFIDELCRLKRDGLIRSVTHVGNRARNRVTLMFGLVQYLQDACGYPPEAAAQHAERALDRLVPGPWSTLGCVDGNRGEVRAILREIRRRTRHLARIRVLSEQRIRRVRAVGHALRALPPARDLAMAFHAIAPLHGLALGRPTDVAIQNLLWRFGHHSLDAVELDRSRCGLLFINPALPLNGVVAAEVAAAMERIAETAGLTLYLTLNIETDMSMVAVANVLFDREDREETERARACADRIWGYLQRRGLSVYRARVDMMGQIVDEGDPYWRTVRDLKVVLDPDHIIAPGRYNLV